MSKNNNDVERLGLWQMLKSAACAFFGVQKSTVRERDFKRGRPVDFIIIGIIFTALFILVLIVLVKIIMHFAGL